MVQVVNGYRNMKIHKKTIDSRLQGYTDCLSAESNEKLMLKWFEKMTYTQLQDETVVPELKAVKSEI